MSFPKKGKFFPKEGNIEPKGCDPLVDEISNTLKRSLGNSRAGIKTVATWTGANEKTIKNWFGGKYAPSGSHLISLVRHSDEILSMFLTMTGREELLISKKLVAAEKAIEELLMAVKAISKL